jgi:hypothetical protein
VSTNVVARVWALLCLVLWTWSSTHAQNVSDAPVIAPGFAIVSGFSGTGPDAAGKPTIDPGGPVLRVINANSLGGPPQGQAVAAHKPLTIRAGQIGQVYAIALDDAVPPNIYAAATSAYGLPIVVPGGEGVPERVRRGASNARFMPGLFAPYSGAGPGSIWKISGASGVISLFANVTLDGTGNPGPALGGLAFDPASRRIYAADRGTGTIHSFNLQGVDTGRFDHGTQALPSAGLPSIPYDPRRRLDIGNPQFDSGDPATWGYAPPARRVFGLAVHRGRLYYAVAAGPAIWSVSLGPDGLFGVDPRVEFVFHAGPVPVAEIAKILFDDAGDMLLAERGTPTGAADFGALARPDSGRVLRLRAQRPGSDGTPYYWQATGEYAVGFGLDHRNSDGGMALGFGYGRDGVVDPGRCGGTLWVTGSQLRMVRDLSRDGALARDPALAQRLAAGGALALDGLQGSPPGELRPQNTPPWSSPFIDFNDTTERAGASGQAFGHMGDVAVWRICPGPLLPQLVELLSEEMFCPAGFYDSRNQCIPAPCAPGERYRGGLCEKPECRTGERVRGESCCPVGSKWNARTRACSRKPSDQADLAIRKEVGRCAPHEGPCTFRIVLTNDSDVPYTGPIFVGDTINAGAIQSITGPAGWICGPVTGAISACIDLDTALPPRQSVEFSVVAAIPGSVQHWLGCAGVKGDAGKDASDGNDKSCVRGLNDTPAGPGAPDLSVRTSLKSCGANQCEFVVVIRNAGTAAYNGDLRLGEMAGGGTIASLVPFEAGWSLPCQQGPAPPGGTGLVCYRHNTSLQPGDTLTMAVTVAHPPGTRLVGHCAIVDLPPGDTNPGNNGSCAEHRPQDTRSRLVVAKALKAPCERIPGTGFGYDGWSCEFDTTVTNTGPARFAGDIKLTDTMTPGRIVSVRGEGAECPAYGASALCQWFDKTLAPGGSTMMTVRVHLPTNVPYESCARFDAPASGEQACLGGMPADAPLLRDAAQPDPVCTGGTFLMRPPAGAALCCSLRSIVAGTCGGIRTGCAAGTSFNLRTGACEKKERAACAGDATLRDGTCCPEAHTVGVDGRCEPPLLCLGGKIARGGECACPPSRREVDGECTEEPVRVAQECPADRAIDAATSTCVCRSGLEEGGICLPAAVADCTGGRVLDAATNQCVTPVAGCTVDQVRIGDRCLSADPGCDGGKIRLVAGAACSCPRGTVEQGGRCQTVQARGGRCAGGTRNILTGQCACPRGTALVNEDCVPADTGPGFTPVICPGETRVVGGFCACPGDMQVQSDSACACPAGFGIKAGGSTPTGRKERGLCELCPADQRLTPDGYCAPACPQELGWVCLPPGSEANPVAQGSNCACRSLTPLIQTSSQQPACPRGQIRQFDSCCTPEAIAAGTCGGAAAELATVCQAPLVAFAGRCCTRDAVGTARCAAPALGAAVHGGCRRGEVRGSDGRCQAAALQTGKSRRSTDANPARKRPPKSKRR